MRDEALFPCSISSRAIPSPLSQCEKADLTLLCNTRGSLSYTSNPRGPPEFPAQNSQNSSHVLHFISRLGLDSSDSTREERRLSAPPEWSPVSPIVTQEVPQGSCQRGAFRKELGLVPPSTEIRPDSPVLTQWKPEDPHRRREL